MKRDRFLCGVLALVLWPSPGHAQQASEETHPNVSPDTPGTLSLHIQLTDDAKTFGSGLNQAFGHSGASFQFSPVVNTPSRKGRLLDMTLRLDARDALYELGVPALLSMQLKREGLVDVSLDASVGFDHLGVTMLMPGGGEVGLSKQSTAHMRLTLQRGPWTLGAAGGAKRYTARIKDRLEIDRQWTMFRPYLVWRPHERVGFELSSQVQWWMHANPGDRMRQGDRALTHQLAMDVQVSREVSIQVLGGARQDRARAPYDFFVGGQLTWSPSFGKEETPSPSTSSEP